MKIRICDRTLEISIPDFVKEAGDVEVHEELYAKGEEKFLYDENTENVICILVYNVVVPYRVHDQTCYWPIFGCTDKGLAHDIREAVQLALESKGRRIFPKGALTADVIASIKAKAFQEPPDPNL
jgi:hypothetical protein